VKIGFGGALQEVSQALAGFPGSTPFGGGLTLSNVRHARGLKIPADAGLFPPAKSEDRANFSPDGRCSFAGLIRGALKCGCR